MRAADARWGLGYASARDRDRRGRTRAARGFSRGRRSCHAAGAGAGTMTEFLLEIHGLCKSFGALVATDNVSLKIPIGETHALIGPNGAGKTTLVGQLTGDIIPDAGRIR